MPLCRHWAVRLLSRLLPWLQLLVFVDYFFNIRNPARQNHQEISPYYRWCFQLEYELS